MSKELPGQLSIPGIPEPEPTQLATSAPLPSGEMMESVFGPLSGRSMHNFKGKPEEVWRMVAKATGPAAMPGSTLGDKAIDLEYWYAHVVQLQGDSNGEIVEQTRVVLFDRSGDCYSWVSAGMVMELGTIIQAFGFGPYKKDGPKFRVQQVQTGNKRRTYKIVPV